MIIYSTEEIEACTQAAYRSLTGDRWSMTKGTKHRSVSHLKHLGPFPSHAPDIQGFLLSMGQLPSQGVVFNFLFQDKLRHPFVTVDRFERGMISADFDVYSSAYNKYLYDYIDHLMLLSDAPDIETKISFVSFRRLQVNGLFIAGDDEQSSYFHALLNSANVDEFRDFSVLEFVEAIFKLDEAWSDAFIEKWGKGAYQDVWSHLK